MARREGVVEEDITSSTEESQVEGDKVLVAYRLNEGTFGSKVEGIPSSDRSLVGGLLFLSIHHFLAHGFPPLQLVSTGPKTPMPLRPWVLCQVSSSVTNSCPPLSTERTRSTQRISSTPSLLTSKIVFV